MIALVLPALWALARRGLGRLFDRVSGAVATPLGAALSAGAPIALGVVALLALALWLRLGAVQAARDAAAADRDRLAHSVEAQAGAIAARDAALAALAAEAEAARARAEALSLARQEILDAPLRDDGVVAPVLGRALERLRGAAGP